MTSFFGHIDKSESLHSHAFGYFYYVMISFGIADNVWF